MIRSFERRRRWRGPPGPKHHVLQRERVEVVAHVLADVGPHREEHALALVVAGTVLMWLAEVSDDDRAVDRTHYLAEGDLLRQPGEDVPAPHAPLGADEAGALERQQDLLQIGLRKACPLGDVPDRRR